MKITLVLFYFSITCLAFGQDTLDGKYCSTSSYAGFCVEFRPNNFFTYEFGDCMGSGIGSGTYQLTKKKLTLNFEEHVLTQHVVVKDTLDQTGEEAKFYIQVIEDGTAIGIHGASVFLSTSAENHSYSTDFDGKTKFCTKIKSETVNVNVILGDKHYSFPIVPNHSKVIQVTLLESNLFVIQSGRKDIYHLKEVKTDQLILSQDKQELILKKTIEMK